MMLSPLGAVWLSWRTRPLMWCLPLPLLFIGLMARESNNRTSSMTGTKFPGQGVIYHGEILRQHIDSRQSGETVRAIDFRFMREPEQGPDFISLAAEDVRRFSDIQGVLLQFPNLEAIHFRGSELRNLNGAILRQLTELKWVSIGPVDVTEKDLQQLALIPNLTHVELEGGYATADLSLLRSVQITAIDPDWRTEFRSAGPARP